MKRDMGKSDFSKVKKTNEWGIIPHLCPIYSSYKNRPVVKKLAKEKMAGDRSL